MAKAPINVTISGDYNDRDIKRAIKDLQSLQKDGGKTSQSLGTSFKDIAAKAALVGGAIAGVGAVINSFVQSASNLAESQSKVGVVFAENADEVMAWAKQSAVAFGQTEQQALEAAGTYGNLFQAFGLTRDAATEMSTTMVELAADLASFNNTSIDDAIEALRSGLSGETEPLKRLGIALNDSRMKAEAMALGIYEGTGALNAAQKAQAAYAVIMKDTTLAQGDFARTSDGLANQQRILEAQFGNLTAQIGTALLPAALAVVGALNSFIGVIARVTTFVQDNSKAFAVATAAVIALTASMLANRIGGIALAAQYAAGIIQVGLYTAGVTIARIATIALTAAMRAIPFIAVIAGATALVMALSDLETESSKARKAANDHAKSLREQNEQLGYVNNTGRTWLATSKAVTSAQRGTRDAVSATVSAAVQYGNTLPGVTDKTDELADASIGAAKSIYALLEAAVNAARLQRELATTSGTVTSALREGIETGPAVGDWLSKLQEGYVRAEEATKRTGGATRSLKDDFKATFGEASKKAIADTLDTLKTKLDEAKAKFDQFASGISSGLFGQLNIGGAVDQAQESGGSIVGAFVDQAAGIQAFGDKLQQLLQTNLSEEAFAMVASLSAEKGTLLANELLGANSETLIANFNQAVEATKTVADLVGQNAALKWYQTGVDSAQKTYEGFRDNFKKDGPGYKALQNLMDNLAASMKRETTVTVTTINRTINEVVSNPKFGGARAMGGPVSANTAYLVGERGPELFIPDMAGTIVPNGGSAGGGSAAGGIYLTVNAGMGTDGAEVGRQIVDALKQYQRRNGPIPVSVNG